MFRNINLKFWKSKKALQPLADNSPLTVRVLNEESQNMGEVLGITPARAKELIAMANYEIQKVKPLIPFETISKQCNHANELVFVTWHIADACFILQMQAQGIFVMPHPETKK